MKLAMLRILRALLLISVAGVTAQAEEAAVRVAIICEANELAPAADLLTVELATMPLAQVLERAEIEKVHREQAYSAANRDYVKLGQVLGADGLVLMDRTAVGTNQFASVRLVAVKPGALIASERAAWPVPDLPNWAHWVGSHLNPLLPKLRVSASNAIPISVVNLRSAVRSGEAQELERQLTLLAVERLTREPELFVLERRRMDLLGTEKEFQGTGESAFWSGSYLLEGVIDRDGYAKDQATIHARLVPPRGGAPVEIVVTGPRGGALGMVVQLTERVLTALRLAGTAGSWEPEKEAAKYYEEAKWALKWKLTDEARAAAQSAWTLGKQDMECATVRVRTYAHDLQSGPHGLQPVHEMLAAGPQLKYLLQAREALTIYEAFCHTLPGSEPRPDSPWYKMGVQALEDASIVLRAYHADIRGRETVKDTLAEVRGLAREIAARLLRVPAVRDTYWVGRRVVTHDELAHTIAEPKNIFRCQALWGAFWQEQPEDGITMYRDLVSSPVFCYVHAEVWRRPDSFADPPHPRLASWTPVDRNRVPALWQAFVHELRTSTNYLLQLEAKAFAVADAMDVTEQEAAYTELMAGVFEHSSAMMMHNVDLLYLEWGIGSLLARTDGHPNISPVIERRWRDDSDRLAALSKGYWQRRTSELLPEGLLSAAATAGTFRERKAYLSNRVPFEAAEFRRLFLFGRRPTAEEAKELLPLLASYRSNLVTRTANQPSLAPDYPPLADSLTEVALVRISNCLSGWSTSAPHWSPSVETSAMKETRPASQLTNPFTSLGHPRVSQMPSPDRASPFQGSGATPPPHPQSSQATSEMQLPSPHHSKDGLQVASYHPLPLDRVSGRKVRNTSVFAQRVRDRNVLLDLRYEELMPARRVGTKYYAGQWRFRAGIAIWHPEYLRWEVIPYRDPGPPDLGKREQIAASSHDRPGLYVDQLGQTLYASDYEAIHKREHAAKNWERLALPGQKLSRLFVLDGRLFAASDESIMELADEGTATRVLASCRRRPAVTRLDSFESFYDATLFPGPGGTLRAAIAGRVYQWNGMDWDERVYLPGTQAQVCEDTVLLRSTPYGRAGQIWSLGFHMDQPELCWREGVGDPSARLPPTPRWSANRTDASVSPSPLWTGVLDVPLVDQPSTATSSNLFFYVDRSRLTHASGTVAVASSVGVDANLICLTPALRQPLVIPLRFPPEAGPAPGSISLPPRVSGLHESRCWLLLNDQSLFIGHAALPGVWVLPRAELDAAIDKERQAWRPQPTASP